MRFRHRRPRVTVVRCAEGRPPNIAGAEEASQRLAEAIRSGLAPDHAAVLGWTSAPKSRADNSDQKEAAMQPHLGPETP